MLMTQRPPVVDYGHVMRPHGPKHMQILKERVETLEDVKGHLHKLKNELAKSIEDIEVRRCKLTSA